MQIVIDIDDREWMDEKSIREVAFEYEKGCAFDRAIREGLNQAIVLPANHGDLIDRGALLDKLKGTSRYFNVKYDIEEAPTIIEGTEVKADDE